MSSFELSIPDDLVNALVERAVERMRAETPEPDEWLDTSGAADYLKCSRGRIFNLTSSGRLPHHKDGGRNLYRRSELDAYVRGRAG